MKQSRFLIEESEEPSEGSEQPPSTSIPWWPGFASLHDQFFAEIAALPLITRLLTAVVVLFGLWMKPRVTLGIILGLLVLWVFMHLGSRLLLNFRKRSGIKDWLAAMLQRQKAVPVKDREQLKRGVTQEADNPLWRNLGLLGLTGVGYWLGYFFLPEATLTINAIAAAISVGIIGNTFTHLGQPTQERPVAPEVTEQPIEATDVVTQEEIATPFKTNDLDQGHESSENDSDHELEKSEEAAEAAVDPLMLVSAQDKAIAKGEQPTIRPVTLESDEGALEGEQADVIAPGPKETPGS